MRQDDLTPLEQRLAACRPASTGLDADAMLFAAGKAAATPVAGTRWPWPAATCCFAVLSLALTAALVGERSERLSLAARLDRQVEPSVNLPTLVPDFSPPAADSYIAGRRWIETGDEASFVRSDPKSPSPSPQSLDDTPVLRVWPTEVGP